ncbi:MFS transporter [Occallatibacter riparius]|uniref:MFS transporter n=1 Tax=Occallatibacter riparius TaxID=1002689 RepID=A0A9J7BXK0_9BACT|nr:MFS transporter [Occallatibacter riparius]UWZ85917.1 MFS transporter [Occallatibacter riparius]
MLIFASILAIFVYGMIAAMLGTILPDLSDRFRLSPAQNGTIATAQAIGLMIASLAVGPLLDTQGDKIGLLLGLAFIAIALFGLPRSGGYGSIVFLMFLLGIGGGIVVTGANALASAVSADHRATALNLVNLFFGLGGLLTPFISANLFNRNWVRLCYTIAVLTVVVAVYQIAVPMPAPAGGTGSLFTQAGPLLGRPMLYLLGLFLFLYISCEVGVWNWLARHLIAQGIPESKALNILSLGFALGLLVGRVAVSPVFKSVSPVVVLLIASVAMAITTFLMLQTTKPGAAAALVFVAGVAMAPVFPTTLAITGTAFPQMTGTALGFVITCGWAGLAVSSRIIGAIAGPDPLRIRKALLVLPAFSVLMIGLNVIIWMSLR